MAPYGDDVQRYGNRISSRKHRRDKSEISCCLKYLIFGFNVIFWLLGLSIMIIGVWAWTEKDIFNNLSKLTNIALDPAFVLIVIGGITFIIGFTGCVGALRENTCLLAAKTEETFGAEKTDYDADLVALMHMADETKIWTDKIIHKTEAVLEPNPTARVGEWFIDKNSRLNVLDELSADLLAAAAALGPVTPYGKVLTKVSAVEKELGTLQREFLASVDSSFVQPLKKYLKAEMKQIIKERAALEGARLDLDAAKKRAKKLESKNSDDSEAVKDVETCTAGYERQVEVVRELLHQIPEAHVAHAKALTAFVEAQAALYAKGAKYMKDLQKDLRSVTLELSYAIFLAILLLLEMTAGILGFIFKDWIKAQATNGFQAFIVFYRDDPDRQNLIDWIQEQWLGCCGIEGPKDWDMNIYFNCSSVEVGSREACGVPFSCCKRQPNELIKNKQCGYDVRKPDYQRDKSHVIYEKGCLRAGEEWIEANLVPVAGVAVGLAVLQDKHMRTKLIYERGCLHLLEEWVELNLVPLSGAMLIIAFIQILGICFAQNLRADIFAQKAKWH
ncbi:tetraspanin-5 isoform 3 [Tropilaelaps mercedesae]|uniref:Tetraspanin-5 isoform 3 n=1 Tax=Tropilaelaps mercedesae TaxID=418985 RepID=A0A1V9X890_9ACAR|nr:tetraspanin-5 isoform 3 [Tropilaelaps mercedesae]